MMSEFYFQKRELISQVYEKAKSTTTETSFSGILKNLEFTLLDDFGVPLSYRTFETYYKNLVENETDYKIKTLVLNDLSKYLGYSDFNEFNSKNPINPQNTKIKVTTDGKETTKESRRFSDIIINITNAPVFTLPEFITKHSNSFGLVGILLVSGFLFKNKEDFFGLEKKESLRTVDSALIINKNEGKSTLIHLATVPRKNSSKELTIIPERKMECMYWNGEVYVDVFCDELIEGREIIALNEERKRIRKITKPDTLTIENALGKVWYDKSNGKVEFFTHYGIHPENGKTLKEVSSHILEVYAKK